MICECEVKTANTLSVWLGLVIYSIGTYSGSVLLLVKCQFKLRFSVLNATQCSVESIGTYSYSI